MQKTCLNRVLVTGMLFFFGRVCMAQEVSPELVSGCAANLSQSAGSISFTVGEIAVLTYTDDAGNTLSGGFGAGTALSVSVIEVNSVSLIDLNVYPNPAQDFLNIRINQSSQSEINVSIVDMQGKEVFGGQYAGIPRNIGLNTTSIASGTYILSVTNAEGVLLGKYNLIKF